MKTASFFTYRGAGRISIARYAPRDAAPGFKVFRALAPGDWYNIRDQAMYTRLYLAQLSMLDPREVMTKLTALAGDAEPILLCWEKPPFNERNFCHRRIVSSWLESAHPGIEIPELIAG